MIYRALEAMLYRYLVTGTTREMSVMENNGIKGSCSPFSQLRGALHVKPINQIASWNQI